MNSADRMNRRAFLQTGVRGLGGLALAVAQIRASFAATAAAAIPPAGESVDVQELRRQYSLSPQIVYFNHGSIGTIPKPVQKAHLQYLSLCEKNPWLYMWGGEWEEPRAEVRRRAAELLQCDAGEIALTHNTTEAFNLLAQGLPLRPGDEVLFSSINHPGASICWFHHSKTRGYSVRRFEFPLQKAAELTEDALLQLYEEQISPKTRVLVFPHLDNMVGIRHPVRKLAQIARSKGVKYVAVDGAQTVGMIPVRPAADGVDFYATSPHKWLQAPKGLGLLYIRKEVQADVHPMWVTWGQNRWKGTVRIFEDYGTRNLPEVLALGDAIDFQMRLGEARKEERLRKLWSHFKQRVEAHPKLVWRSPKSWELGASLYAVEVRGANSTEVFQTLYREAGFVMRPFHTKELNTLRITPNVFNTVEEMDRFFAAVDRHFG